MTAEQFFDEHAEKIATGIGWVSGKPRTGHVRNCHGDKVFIAGGENSAWCHIDTVRLVDDAPKPAQVMYRYKLPIAVGEPVMVYPVTYTPPPYANHVDFQPLAGLEDAAARRFRELTAPLVMAMEETLAHLHTVSAYVRNEKQFSATHEAVTRRLAQVLREHKGGK